jgi:hypothetical protein
MLGKTICLKQKRLWPTLRRRLVQLQFPIEPEISSTPEYRASLNNWDRLRAYRTEWEAQRGNRLWFNTWQRLQPKKSLFQDRFLILNGS